MEPTYTVWSSYRQVVIMEDLCILYIICNYLTMMDKMPVQWKQVYSYCCSWVVYHLNCLQHWSAFAFFFQYLIKSRFVNSEMFTASTNTGNFKLVVILVNGVCAIRLVCLQGTDNSEHVYQSVHIPLLSSYNNLKSLVITVAYSNWGTCHIVTTSKCM